MQPRQLTMPAEPASLKTARAFFRSFLEGLPTQTVEQVVLALDECCANIIRHRCDLLDDQKIRIDCERSADRLTFRIGRFCLASDVDSIHPRDLKEVRPGGLGTRFVNEIMSRVTYHPDPEFPGAMVLVLEKQLDQEDLPHV
jgi:anti-sigma regulatory factor (Ser/Thr protein kinase)